MGWKESLCRVCPQSLGTSKGSGVHAIWHHKNGKIDTLSRAGENVHDPAVGNREESLDFLTEVRDTIPANLVQTSLQPFCPPLAVVNGGTTSS